METQIIKIDLLHIDPQIIVKAVKLILADKVVAFPTETVYGLGANVFSENAVKKIFEAKNRPADNPLIVHIASREMLTDLVNTIPQNVYALIDKFWPGPLTILFEKSSKVPSIVTAGLSTIAIRYPSHPVAQALIETAKVPIAAPSANASGRPSPTTAEHVYMDLKGRIPLIIDAGPTQVGVESTVIDVNRDPPLILRPGGVTLEQLRVFLPTIQVYEKERNGVDLEQHPPTPGLKYRHYAPKAQVILFEGISEKMGSSIKSFLEKELANNVRLGLIHTQPKIIYPAHIHGNRNLIYYPLGNVDHPEIIAKGIFKALRDLDSQLVEMILVEGISEAAEGLAIMNRLRKAASKIIHIE